MINTYKAELSKSDERTSLLAIDPYAESYKFNEYAICYINEDDIPELIVVDKDGDIVGDGYSTIWLSDLDKALQCSVTPQGVPYKYIEKEGTLYSVYNASGWTEDTIYKIQGQELLPIHSGTAKWVGESPYYFIDERDVSSDEYIDIINSCMNQEGGREVNYVDASSVIKMIIES